MNIQEIVVKTGKTQKYIGYIFDRKRRPSPELARQLEQITGIDRRAWLWPDEFPNSLLNSSIQSNNP